VNVVEDARIEKLMKRRYAGLPRPFYNGYKELADEDFFQIKMKIWKPIILLTEQTLLQDW
jgi:hypothetical protein